MGCALARVPPPPPLLLLLLLLLLEAPGAHGLSCNATPVNWAAGLTATCLNFSGQGLGQLPPALKADSLQHLQHLDLSRNRLRQLPDPFFASLEKLQVLDVTGNPLSMVPGTLGARCALELRADCACALAPWYQARVNCSDEPSPWCQAGLNHTQNLTLFLKTHCPGGLGAAAVAGMAVGVCALLTLGLTGSSLACRLRDRRATVTQSPGKTLAASEVPRPGSSRQSRYSSGARSPRAPVVVQPCPASPDYENMFQGDPAQPRWHDRLGSANDSDCYMEYEEPDADPGPQAIYCNLQTLNPETEQDEEDYVVPGR